MRCAVALQAFVLTVVCLSSVSAVADEPKPPASTSGNSDRPNILFIFSDDHALQAIGAYGSTINQTPNLDRIAKEGAVFNNSFCANSICGPSRACILTGKHSHQNGFLRNGNRFDGSQMTFPKLFQGTGYQTALIGKWHLGTDPTGFDHWEVLPGQGHYYNPDFLQMGGGKKRFDGYVTDIITEKTIEWLDGRDPNKPFVMMCQHKAPHRNWAPPQRYLTLYDDVNIPEPDSLFDNYDGRSELLHQNEMSIARHFSWAHDMKLHGPNQFPSYFTGKNANREYDRMTDDQKAIWDEHYESLNQDFISKLKTDTVSENEVTSWKYQRYIKDYLRCVQAVDDSVGTLLQYLDDNGLAENTLVIYSSDQGFYLGEHGWYDKRWMFEESLRMPFLVRWPGKIHPGTTSNAMIQNIDYAPTFLDVIGAEIPAEIQGRSLTPVLQGHCEAPADWRDAIYYAYYENAAVHNVPVHDGVRTERYKLMFFPRDRSYNLFDLETDPNEMVSVHDQPAYADVLAGMKARYQDLRGFYDVNTAVIPATRGDETRWAKRDAELTARSKQGPYDLVFLGDSITQGWEGRGKRVWEEFYGDAKALNLGIGGDRTEHIIWRLQRGNLHKIRPEKLVLMIGTNNTGHLMQDPAEVAQGVRAILDLIHKKSPKTKVILQAIFPRGEGIHDPMRLNNDGINRRLRRFGADPRVTYVDFADEFLEADGSISTDIMPDRLHLSTEGYVRWAEALAPYLKSDDEL